LAIAGLRHSIGDCRIGWIEGLGESRLAIGVKSPNAIANGNRRCQSSIAIQAMQQCADAAITKLNGAMPPSFNHQ
jgi:hypothetical protein